MVRNFCCKITNYQRKITIFMPSFNKSYGVFGRLIFLK